MGQIKKLSAGEVIRVTGISGKQAKKVVWHSADLTIRQLLPVDEYVSLVQKIITDCVNGDGELMVEMVDFSIRKNIVESYAYVDLPSNPSDQYYVLYMSDIYDCVCRNACRSQIEAIWESVALYTR